MTKEQLTHFRDMYEAEIRKQERQKVIAELEEYFELKDLEAGIIPKYSMIDLKQKLNEMKGEKQ